MSLTSSLLTGYTGIKSNQTMVNTVGDNIANLNTTSFKKQRTLFETLLYETVSEGEAPTGRSGGVLPTQIGRGSTVSAIQRNFSQGTIEATGLPTDVAINGKGFFVVQSTPDQMRFTRDGAFALDANNKLVSANGAPVLGFVADSNGDIQVGSLSELTIPLGTTAQAQATSNVVLDGSLDAADEVATAGVISSEVLNTSNGPADSNTLLTDLVDSNGLPLFATGNAITLDAQKGGINEPKSTFVVGDTGTTLGDYAGFLQTGLGLDTATDPNAGVKINNGALVVTSNVGKINAVNLSDSAISSDGTTSNPFSFTEQTPATGAGVSTSFNVFDSLGNSTQVRLRLVLESKTGGTQYRFFAESAGNSNSTNPIVGTGTLSFDSAGQFVSATGTQIQIDRSSTGAASPLTADLDFSGLTALAPAPELQTISMASQDGSPSGVMVDFQIGSDGIIKGKFSNDTTKTLGQLAVATFVNDEGLIGQSQNLFTPGPDSGNPTITVAGDGIAGAIVPGSLEQSNVELVREFVDLISASTGISAASRVVRTSDDMLQELLLLGR